jgi:kumamolisin
MGRPLEGRIAALIVLLSVLCIPAPAVADIDYGPISHNGLKKLGAASTSDKLPLKIGLGADMSGLHKSVKKHSNPSSSEYGKYPSISTLASKYGAPKNKRQAVTKAFKQVGVTPKFDPTHLLAKATLSIKKAQKLFGVKWNVYKNSSGARFVLPASKPKAPKGIKGNVGIIAGTRLQLSQGTSSAVAEAAAFDGGTPTRTGTPSPGCAEADYPGAYFSGNGLFPNQILTAYGIAPLQANGLLGQGARLAIVGEAPTPANDVKTFRSCFGTSGTQLAIHNANGIKPVLESSLDAMVSSTVAPKLAALDLWVHPLSESDDDGDALGFLEMMGQPLKATTNGHKLPHVISVSYGVCESKVAPYTASVKLVDRELAAYAALGTTVVVASGDSGSSACSRGVKPNQLTSSEKKPQVSWPASSPWVLAVGGTNLTLTAQNAIASTGPWNDTAYPAPYTASAGGGGGQSTFEQLPWWQPSQSFANSKYRMVPDIAAFADESPGYLVICSSGVESCPAGQGQTLTFVGGTSAAAPLVAGMIALWQQQSKALGLPRPGFIPPMLYKLAKSNPTAFVDITTGGNALFGGSCCPARPGFDLATGWGSPLADVVAQQFSTRR